MGLIMDVMEKGAYLSSPVETGRARAISAISMAIRTRFIRLPCQPSITKATILIIQNLVPRTWLSLTVPVPENISYVVERRNGHPIATDGLVT